MGHHRGLKLGWWHGAVLLAIAATVAAGIFAISVAGQARAQKDDPDPEELWEAYPLDPEGKRTEPPAPPGTTGSPETPTASPTRAPATTPAAAPAEDDGGGLPVAVLLAAALAAFTGGLAAGRVRKRRNAIGTARATHAPNLVIEPQLWSIGPRPSVSDRGSSSVEPTRSRAEPEIKPAEPARPPAASEIKPGEPARSPVEPEIKPVELDATTPGFLDVAPPDPEELPLVEPEPAEPLELALPDPPPPPKPPKRGLERDVLEALDRDAPEVETRRLKPVDLDASGLRTPDPEPVARQEAPEIPTPGPEPATHADRPARPTPRAQPRARAEPPARPTPRARAEPPARATPRREPPARRFERPEPWPEAEHEWTCEIDWKSGYVKSYFRAMAAPPGEKRRRPIGESSSVRWSLMMEPEPPTDELVEAVRELMDALHAAGWERTYSHGPWYALRFRWRGEGLPQRLEIQPRKALKGTEDKDG